MIINEFQSRGSFMIVSHFLFFLPDIFFIFFQDLLQINIASKVSMKSNDSLSISETSKHFVRLHGLLFA